LFYADLGNLLASRDYEMFTLARSSNYE